MSTDLLLDNGYQLVPQASGDAAMVSGNACFLQTLKLEAAASEGDLWYDPSWGWSLIDFKAALQDELTTLEIEQRVHTKLAAHEDIAVDSIDVTTSWIDEQITIAVSFRLLSDGELQQLKLNIGRTEIEVIDIA